MPMYTRPYLAAMMPDLLGPIVHLPGSVRFFQGKNTDRPRTAQKFHENEKSPGIRKTREI
jgi:hypothetical protein